LKRSIGGTGLSGGPARCIFLGSACIIERLAFGHLAFLFSARGFNDALTGAHLFGREIQIGLKRLLGTRRTRFLRMGGLRGWAALGLNRRRRRPAWCTVDTAALGLNDHRLGPAMAEALLHRACTDRTRSGLQRQGSPAAGLAVRLAGRTVGTVVFIVVRVVHPLALLTSGPRTGPALVFNH
jgi:hypothetical protein